MSSVTSFVGDVPRFYDANLGPVLFQFYAKELASRLARLNPGSVLKVACGTGIDSRATKDALPGARLVATDLNPDMLRLAESKFAPGEAEFKVVDCQELPFGDGSFDAMACQFGIMFVPDRDKALKEALRVLKPGGTLICSVWDGLDENPGFKITHELILESAKTDPPMFLLTPYGLSDRAELRSLFERNGFEGVTVEDVPAAVPADPAALAQGVVYGTPAYGQLKEHPEIALEPFKAELTQRLAALIGKTGILALKAIYVTGTKPAGGPS
ncbi:MAG TPA: methyltransferase domain-containing protein [Fimbriimonadaceae bacterium]|nr:methyltransferase domain-containing protein [Fimbriimonadaceae bacterium]